MEQRRLGKTGLMLSRLGFGAMRLPMKGDCVDLDRAIPLMHRAFSISMGNVVAGNAQIQVVDLLGRKLAALPVSRVFGDYSARVDLSRLPKGIYLIRVQSDIKTIFSDKILIE